MKNQPTVDLTVQYVTDLSTEYPDLSVGIVRSSENLSGGQVVVVMDSETADALARVMIQATRTTNEAESGMTWIRAAIDMFTASALAPLPAAIAPQVGVLVDLPMSAADLDARDQANVNPPLPTYPCVCGLRHKRNRDGSFEAPADGVAHGPISTYLDGIAR